MDGSVVSKAKVSIKISIHQAVFTDRQKIITDMTFANSSIASSSFRKLCICDEAAFLFSQ